MHKIWERNWWTSRQNYIVSTRFITSYRNVSKPEELGRISFQLKNLFYTASRLDYKLTSEDDNHGLASWKSADRWQWCNIMLTEKSVWQDKHSYPERTIWPDLKMTNYRVAWHLRRRVEGVSHRCNSFRHIRNVTSVGEGEATNEIAAAKRSKYATITGTLAFLVVAVETSGVQKDWILCRIWDEGWRMLREATCSRNFWLLSNKPSDFPGLYHVK